MRLLALVGALAVIVGIAAAIFFFGGFWSVAESGDDPGIVNWALNSVRGASVARHATDVPPANFDEPAIVQAGARVYSIVDCVNCHGGAGRQMGQVLRRPKAGPRRSRRDGEGADSIGTLLGDQERRQVLARRIRTCGRLSLSFENCRPSPKPSTRHGPPCRRVRIGI
jgi:hypothetical protein